MAFCKHGPFTWRAYKVNRAYQYRIPNSLLQNSKGRTYLGETFKKPNEDRDECFLYEVIKPLIKPTKESAMLESLAKKTFFNIILFELLSRLHNNNAILFRMDNKTINGF